MSIRFGASVRSRRASTIVRSPCRLCEAKGVEFAARPASGGDFAASGGAVPIVLRRSGMVGVATIGRLSDTQDHALVAAPLRGLRESQRRSDASA
ncbi:heme-binding protein [Aureimonas pseudogalii]|uniref:Uncharacterized protein (UPF0303 family) n=1 Tax=Aureimonas pseudogalii TaxID=1744844 RepID=A0A7W6EE43_9HYPH|nr:heme-binding protein [Aureimonas pseudogalii]MBB3997647.1 uncharacterized protein (UPF0303 family) [Aureimonas pseudogalii]